MSDTKPLSQQNSNIGDEADKPVAKKRRAPGGGRKAKKQNELYVSISMRLHPKVMEWAKAEAEKQGIGYQSFINETLLKQIPS